MTGPRETAGMHTSALRETFLACDLFRPSELRIVVTDMDRLLLGGAMPADTLELAALPGSGYFTERRELGVINLGESGHIAVGEDTYSLAQLDVLYIGAGNPRVSFSSCNGSRPLFYFLSCPAHRRLPVRHIKSRDTAGERIGSTGNASRRTLRKYIHPDGGASCQLVMGLTQLDPGSVWNTLPPHTHSRRSEVYLYTGLGDAAVIHLMGEPGETRHLVVRDNQAVLSPSWSVHSGAGTASYSFVWGMAGENQTFTDIDPVEPHQLR